MGRAGDGVLGDAAARREEARDEVVPGARGAARDDDPARLHPR